MTGVIQPISQNIPTPKKGMPEWGPEYLIALDKAEGHLAKASKMIGKTYAVTYKARMAESGLFFNAVAKITDQWDSRHLAELEEVSMTQAKKPGNITERLFNMKALNPGKYREKATPISPVINITVGYQMGPDPPRFGHVVDPENEHDLSQPVQVGYEVIEETDPPVAPTRDTPDNVLSEGDIDIDL